MLRTFTSGASRALTRSYAAKAAAASVKPPVQLYGLDGTYATALYVAASKDSSIDATEKSLANLKELFANDKKAEAILADPSLDAATKTKVIEEIVSAVKGDKILTGFLETLSAYNRLNLTSDVIKQFEVLSNAHRGLVEATVTSAAPLDKKSLARVEKAIQGSQYVGEGKTLQLENIVDENIKGGLVVTIGDKTADLSVASKLQKYNSLLQESV